MADSQTLLETLQAQGDFSSEVSFTPPREGDVQRSVLEVSPFVDTFGTPMSVAEGLPKTMAWFKGQ